MPSIEVVSLRLRDNRAAAVAIAGFVVLLAVLALALPKGAGEPGPATGAAALVPGDALAYVHLSTDRSRPAVRRGERLLGRFPDHLLLGSALIGRLSAVAGGGTTVDFATQIRPWLGREAAVALLNEPGAQAGSLIVLDVGRRAAARRFVAGAGAARYGSHRGVAVYRYPSGTELAFIGHYLAAGSHAGVRASIDAFEGREASLAGSATYQAAASGEPSGRVLDAYISAAGVRRMLVPRSGVVASLGLLLSGPGITGTTMSVSAGSGGARVRLHSVVSRAGAGSGSASGSRSFTPHLARLVPSDSILMLDVGRLDRAAPTVLAAAAQAGIGAAVAPLLSRLGSALSAEGVNTHSVLSIFDGEGVVAIGPSRSLIVIARPPRGSNAAAVLADLEGPLAQLFPPPASGPGQAPEFNDQQMGDVTVHQLSLAPGLELNYTVWGDAVVISTSMQGIADVVRHARSLTSDPGYLAAVHDRPDQVTSLLFLDFSQLLNLEAEIGLTRSGTYGQLQPDVQKVRAVGMVSTRGESDTTAELSFQIP